MTIYLELGDYCEIAAEAGADLPLSIPNFALIDAAANRFNGKGKA